MGEVRSSLDNHTAANPDEFYGSKITNDGPEILGIGSNVDTNPYKSWTVLAFPCSTADFYSGTGEFHYEEDGKSGTVIHHGHTNYTLFMKEAITYIDNPDAVLVTGFSAGGFGASLLANDAFTNYFPSVENKTVLVDGALLLNAHWKNILYNVWHSPKEISDCVVSDNLVLDNLRVLQLEKKFDGITVADWLMDSMNGNISSHGLDLVINK